MSEPRKRLLLAAERLFAERGIEAVSLREIGAAAGSRNNSAVQYHFGTKEDLVRSLYEYRLPPLNQRRLDLLAELSGTGRPPGSRALVEAYFLPLAEAVWAAEGPSWYARFVARYQAERGMGTALIQSDASSGVRQVRALLAKALKDLPAAVRDTRLDQMAIFGVSMLADQERRAEHEGHHPGREQAAFAVLIDAIVAMLETPPSAGTRRVIRAPDREVRRSPGG